MRNKLNFIGILFGLSFSMFAFCLSAYGCQFAFCNNSKHDQYQCCHGYTWKTSLWMLSGSDGFCGQIGAKPASDCNANDGHVFNSHSNILQICKAAGGSQVICAANNRK